MLLPPPLRMFAPSGENALYLDDDQFSAGESLDKCAPEIVALFWHSVAPWQARNPYSAAQIHAMAHDDYTRFIGPDVRSDARGTSDQAFVAMLAAHGFAYQALDPHDWPTIRVYIRAGYPIALGGIDEKSVQDLDLPGDACCPYAWERPQGAPTYFHVALATGLDGPDSLKVRDTANLDAHGRLRPGPRRYRTSSLRYSEATALVPHWLPRPPALLAALAA